jgi:hypothetical protein
MVVRADAAAGMSTNRPVNQDLRAEDGVPRGPISGNPRVEAQTARIEPAGIRPLKKSPEHLAALDRVREWTRARFALADDAPILVSQIACGLAGCPPTETVVAFWTADAKRHLFKIFKPVREVVDDDLPFAWLKDSLMVPDGFDCDCC